MKVKRKTTDTQHHQCKQSITNSSQNLEKVKNVHEEKRRERKAQQHVIVKHKKRDVAYEALPSPSNKLDEIHTKQHGTCNLSGMTFENDITFYLTVIHS